MPRPPHSPWLQYRHWLTNCASQTTHW
jgi:hypothetical protein